MPNLGDMLGDDYDASQEKGMDDFSAIPSDNYIMACVKGEWKKEKTHKSDMLVLQFKVQEGEYKGRLVFVNLCLAYPEGETAGMARKQMTSIAKACGIKKPQSHEELYGIQIECKVRLKPENKTNPASNDIQKYTKIDGVTAGSSEKAETVKKAPQVSFDDDED